MSSPVNLNKARKAKARAETEQRAKENRAKFGRTKAEKTLDKLRAEQQARLSDGHRRDPSAPDG